VNKKVKRHYIVSCFYIGIQKIKYLAETCINYSTFIGVRFTIKLLCKENS